MPCAFVLDAEKRPLMPCTPARARILLDRGKAAVFLYAPFTIILAHAVPDAQTQPLRLKIDPGSITTGLAIVNDASGEVVWAAELIHRGQQVKAALDDRRVHRRSRRNRHTRYRKARFANRLRHPGWLPPSLESRLRNILTWVRRLQRLSPIEAISQELVKFDTQLLQSAESDGAEYRQGELTGYDIREYLLEKWQRRCAYCQRTNVPLEVEHIVPKARGGTNRISNLAIACEPCNQRKGILTAEEFGHPEVQAQIRRPLRDAAAVNATRWELYHRLRATSLPVETGTGGRTKWNRIMRNLPKTHWLDAACVGDSTPAVVKIMNIVPLRIRAMGRQRRQMCTMDGYGFPRTKAKQVASKQSFRTGDLVRAKIPSSLKTAGVHVGRAVAKADGRLTITTLQGSVPGVSNRYCTLLQHSDGYSYTKGETALPS